MEKKLVKMSFRVQPAIYKRRAGQARAAPYTVTNLKLPKSQEN